MAAKEAKTDRATQTENDRVEVGCQTTKRPPTRKRKRIEGIIRELFTKIDN